MGSLGYGYASGWVHFGHCKNWYHFYKYDALHDLCDYTLISGCKAPCQPPASTYETLTPPCSDGSDNLTYLKTNYYWYHLWNEASTTRHCLEQFESSTSATPGTCKDIP